MDGIRVASPLPADLDALVQKTIGACIEVHKELGPGLLEGVYPRALARELEALGIGFDLEHSIPIRYKGHAIAHHRLDLFVEGRLVVEIKSVDRLNPIHVAQVVSYLRVTGVRVGLLVNFNVPLLKHGIRRVVL
jgi:GxxExxY protein